MRKYKFRCWYRNKMHYDITGFEFYGEGSLSGVFIDGDFADDIELMQFTGLHDKNGKEIYEGDIISNGYEKCIVVWVKEYAGFMLKLINKEYEDKEWTNPMIDLRNDEEVIGNIYENSDLLKEADNIE